ncbi:cobalamin-binding protein [Paraherbaspirillum soli]|uniref:Cobalamin-binding protein n=1 Tax=Paraherbaspirillum soli TaxID=631222 RepID=A0ABW0M8X6_9BURK
MRYLFFVLFGLLPLAASAAISVHDDAGNTVVLQRPAQRIVTLAPHATELVFAAGGGERIVGAVDYSDYPPAARSIPRIGDSRQLDIERLIALKPDLLVLWLYDNSTHQLEQLRALGIPIFYSEPRKLAEIPDSVLRLGQLLGSEKIARKTAAELNQKLSNLANQYRARSPVRVFYQVWDRPLYTLNGQHIVSDAIRLCGGENIFAKLPAMAPSVSVESVLLENPEAVITGATHQQASSGLEIWKQYPALLAVRRGNLFVLDADLLSRAGPRMIDGAAALCQSLEQARSRRVGQR